MYETTAIRETKGGYEYSIINDEIKGYEPCVCFSSTRPDESKLAEDMKKRNKETHPGFNGRKNTSKYRREMERAILAFLPDHPDMTCSQIINAIRLKKSSCQLALNRLIDAGKITSKKVEGVPGKYNSYAMAEQV